MESASIQRLNTLNREFYDQHAENFADSRPRLAPGIRRVLAQVTPGARVLELGCGDGKTGRWLARNASPALYLGLDNSAAMLERARKYSEGIRTKEQGARGKDEEQETTAPFLLPSSFFLSPSSFVLSDLASPDWTRDLPGAPFNYIFAFAVFHHLPAFETRIRLMGDLAARLAPGGVFAMSNWQFLRSARLQQRVVPWLVLNLTEAYVEPGDHLLAWERKGRRGLRYVHLLNEAEARYLGEHAGLAVTEVFSSDGASGQLAEYVVMKKV